MPLDPNILAAMGADTAVSGGGFLSSVGNVLGAPKHFIDYLARQGSRLQGLQVDEDATTGSLLRAAAGLSPEERKATGGGYGEELGGRAIELIGDIGLDPLTYAMGGLGAAVRGGRTAQAALRAGGLVPEAATAAERLVRAGRIAAPVQKGATAAFAGLMGTGAVQEGAQAYETIKEEGFTPEAAGQLFGTAVSAGGAALSGAHLRGLVKGAQPSPGETVTQAVRNASDQELSSRLDSYERSGQGDLASIVKAEKEWREAKKAGISPDTPPEEAALRKALMGLSTKRQRSGTDLNMMMEAVREGRITSEDAYTAWKSSNKLPDVLGTAIERPVPVEAPPPTPPDQLMAALQASVEAKGVKPVRTAQQVADELASGKPVDEVLPKDFNEFLTQRGFTVKAPKGPKKSAFDEAVERKAVEGEAARVAGLPPEAGGLRPVEGRLAPAAGGERGGVVGPEAAAPGAPGIPGGPPVPVSGRVEAPPVERVALPEDAIPEIKYKGLEFDGPFDKMLYFLRQQEGRPAGQRDAARVAKVLDNLRARGVSEEDIKTVKPAFRKVEPPALEEAPPEEFLPEGDVSERLKRFKPIVEPGAMETISENPSVKFLSGIYSQLFNRAKGASAKAFEAEGGAEVFQGQFMGETFGEHRGAAIEKEKAVRFNPGKVALDVVKKVLDKQITPEQAVQKFLFAAHKNAAHEATHLLPEAATHEGVKGLRHTEAQKEFQRTLSGEENPLLDRALEDPKFAGDVWDAVQETAHLFDMAQKVPKGKPAVPAGKYLTKLKELEEPALEEEPITKVDVKKLKKRLSSMKKLSPDKRKEILKIAKESPEGLEDALRVADNPTKLDKAIEAWKMGLLSGPSTLMVQGSDILETGSRVAESAMAPLVDRLLGGPRTRFSGEAKAEVKGFMRNHSTAVRQLRADLLNIVKAAPEVIDPDRPLEFQTGKIGGKAGRIIRTPGRFMGATSKYLRTTGTGAELSKLSYREAVKELGAKAEKSAIEKRAGEIYQEAVDPSSEAYTDMLKAAKIGGKERVHEQEPGPFMDTLMKLRSENPWMHGLLPFLHVPGNITKLIAQRSPLGFVKAAKSYSAYKRALAQGDRPPAEIERLKGKAVDDITRPLFGTAVMSVFAGATALGNMTGGGPVDKKQRNLLLSGGWQPYSFVLPAGDGKKFYIPYKRVQPIGALLGFAADMMEARELKGGGAKFEKGLESLGQNLTSQTYLQGIADAMEFVSNPREMAAQYASSQAGSLVPNIFAKLAQTIDPTLRETRAMDRGVAGLPESMLRSVQARIPGASTFLPPRISATGEEIQRPGIPLTRLLSFTQPSISKPNQKVVEFLERIDASPGLPQKDVTLRGVKVPLEEEEWRTIAGANAQAMDYIENNYLNNQRFLSLPKVQQKRYVDSVFNRVRALARARLLRGGQLGDRAKEALRAASAGS